MKKLSRRLSFITLVVLIGCGGSNNQGISGTGPQAVSLTGSWHWDTVGKGSNVVNCPGSVGGIGCGTDDTFTFNADQTSGRLNADGLSYTVTSLNRVTVTVQGKNKALSGTYSASRTGQVLNLTRTSDNLGLSLSGR